MVADAGGDGRILPQRIADTVVNIAHSRKINEWNQVPDQASGLTGAIQRLLRFAFDLRLVVQDRVQQ